MAAAKKSTGSIVAVVAGVALMGAAAYLWWKNRGLSAPYSGATMSVVPDVSPLSVGDFAKLANAASAQQAQADYYSSLPASEIKQFNPSNPNAVVVRSPDSSAFDAYTSEQVNAYYAAQRAAMTPQQTLAQIAKVNAAQYTYQVTTDDLVNWIKAKQDLVAAGLPASAVKSVGTSSGGSSGSSSSSKSSSSSAAPTKATSSFTPTAAGNAFRAKLAASSPGRYS